MKKESGIRDNYFAGRMFYRFLVPSLLSSIGLSFGNIMDALVVGNRMGESGLAAISLVCPIYMIFNIFDLGLGIGGSIHFSKLLSAGEAKKGIRLFNQVLHTTAILGLFFAVFGNLLMPGVLWILGARKSHGEVYDMVKAYARVLFSFAPLIFINLSLYHFIRCDDDQTGAAVGLVVGNILDIVLNYVFVIVLDFGVEGAIWSTVIGQIAALFFYLPHLFQRSYLLRVKKVRWEWRPVWECFQTGFASSSQYIFQFFFLIIMNHLLMKIGGKTGVAVFDIVTNVSYIALSVYEGVGATLQPLAATFLGEQNGDDVRRVRNMSLGWGTGIGIGMLAILFLTTEGILNLFGLTEPYAHEIGRGALWMYYLSAFFAGFNVMIGYYFQAIDKEKYVLLINFLRTFAMILLFSFLFAGLGLQWFWCAFPAAEAATLLIWMIGKKMDKKKPLLKLARDRVYRRTLGNAGEEIADTIAEIEEFCGKWGADFRQSYYVTLTVEELCMAIIQNAFGKGREDYIQLTLIAQENGEFTLHIRDSAVSFNPFSMKMKKLELGDDNTEEEMKSVGILIVVKNAKEFFYRRYQGFNTLTVKV
ncbi:MAG: polysaccharide biosynthesis C-terminal domain-containing protein [Lachnospiraceae bacterium]|nr:polysaccharide biosynthesis C-terminal domain-containing protein [Lachnospiraceae bacterium]